MHRYNPTLSSQAGDADRRASFIGGTREGLLSRPMPDQKTQLPSTMSLLSSTEISLLPKKKKTHKRGVCPGFPYPWPARWNYAPATQTHQLANQDRFPSKRHTPKTL